MQAPDVSEVRQQGGGNGHEPLFVTFANDSQEALLGLDILGGKVQGFGDSQPAGVLSGETGTVDGMSHGSDQAADLFVRQGIGETNLSGIADFFWKSAQGR